MMLQRTNAWFLDAYKLATSTNRVSVRSFEAYLALSLDHEQHVGQNRVTGHAKVRNVPLLGLPAKKRSLIKQPGSKVCFRA
jgi:hypothetical protein